MPQKVQRSDWLPAVTVKTDFGDKTTPAYWDNQGDPFDCYTVTEVNEVVNAHVAILNTTIESKVQSLETRMKEELIAAIDSLPKKLLTDEVKTMITKSVIEQIAVENESLRTEISDLKKQFDELKASIK